MEFPNRKSCIDHYEAQFPNLPRYMIEIALDYDLRQQASEKKPLTGAQRRKQKREPKAEPVKREINEFIQDALANAKPLELDCATIVRGEDYKAPPNVKGFVEIDGEVEAKALQTQAEQAQADQAQADQVQVQESVESDEIKL